MHSIVYSFLGSEFSESGKKLAKTLYFQVYFTLHFQNNATFIKDIYTCI